MMKRMNDIVPRIIQIIILGVLALYFLMNKYPGIQNILDMLHVFLPTLLIFVAIIILLIKDKLFASHVVTFLVGYFTVGRNAILSLLSFDFAHMAFQEEIGLMTLLYALIFIYFILMIFSYLVSGKTKGQTDGGKLIIIALSTFLLFYFTKGLENAVLMLLPTFVSLIFGISAASILLILSSLVSIPFDFINLIDQGILLDQSIGYFIFTAIGILIIFFTLKKWKNRC